MSLVRAGLAGQAFVVLGGASGIGRAVCEAIVESEGLVAVGDIASSAASETAASISETDGKAFGFEVDATEEDSVRAIVAEAVRLWGRVDGAVLSVYEDYTGSITELSKYGWERTLDVHLTSAYLLSRAVLPELVRRGGGSIVLVSSVLASMGERRQPAYSAAKAGLNGLVRQLAVDFGPKGVRVNSVSPSVIVTDRNRESLRHPVRRARVVYSYPLRRLGCPSDVARAVRFLLSEESAFVTGEDLRVDGGVSAVTPVSAVEAYMVATGGGNEGSE